MCVPFTLFTVRMGWAQAKVCSGIPTVFSEASPLCALKLAAQCTLEILRPIFSPERSGMGGQFFCVQKILYCVVSLRLFNCSRSRQNYYKAQNRLKLSSCLWSPVVLKWLRFENHLVCGQPYS